MADIGSTILISLLWILGVAVLTIIIVLFVTLIKYKHKVRLKQCTATGKRIKDTKAREYEEDGVKYWRFLYKKLYAPVPPAEVINIDNKGKLCAECYVTETGEIIWIKDEWREANIPDDIKALKNADADLYKAKFAAWVKENNVIEALEPMTTPQRAEIARQIAKKEARKKRNMFDLIRDIAPIIAIVMMITLLLVFWGSIAEPALAQGRQNAAITETQDRILKTMNGMLVELKQIIKQKQLVTGEDIEILKENLVTLNETTQ